MSTNSINKNLYRPDNNTYINYWDEPVNTNTTGIDYALGGTTYFSVTGQSGVKTMDNTYSETYPYPPNNIGSVGSPVTSLPSCIPSNIIITGELSSNVNIQLPAGTGGQWSIYNNTTVLVSGATLTFSISGGGSINLDNGKRRLIVSDGVNISRAESPSDAQGSNGSLQFNNNGVFAGSSLRYVPSSGGFVLSPLAFTGVIDSSGNLTTTGDQPLVSGMPIKSGAGTLLGTVSSGSGTSWVLSGSTATASSTMYAYPSTGSATTAFTINAYENQYGQQIVAGTTAGQSKGLLIRAGTNASDYSLQITDSSASPVDRFSINGHGSVTIAAPSSSSALPSLQVSVPSASTNPAIKSNGGAFTTSVAVPFNATSMTINCALSNVFTTTFSASVTGAPTFSNPSEGQTINWIIYQSGSGHTMTWPSSFKFPYAIAPTLSATGLTDFLVATYINGYWYATLINGY